MRSTRASSVSFAGLLLDLPGDWRDVTDEDDNSEGWTLALENGVGAIQFSVALHEEGGAPNATQADIEQLFFAFCERHNLPIKSSSWANERNFGTGGSCTTEIELTGAWQISDGSNFALVTYTSLTPNDPATLSELQEAEQIVRSIMFEETS